MEAETYIDRLTEFAWSYAPKVLLALALLIVGMWIIRRLTRVFDSFLRRRNVDDSLRPFFVSLHDVGLKVLLLLVVASTVGLETTSFIAIFSAIAFSVGLALQGSLGNFASGVLILLFRPFKVGDLLTVSDQTGKVTAIQIFSTVLTTPEGKRIIIPNGKITEGPIESISENAEVQAEITLLVDSGTALESLRSISDEVAARCEWVLPGRPAEVAVSGITRDDMKVDIACWIYGKHYVETIDFLYEELKKAFDAAGIKLAKERRRETL